MGIHISGFDTIITALFVLCLANESEGTMAFYIVTMSMNEFSVFSEMVEIALWQKKLSIYLNTTYNLLKISKKKYVIVIVCDNGDDYVDV